MVISASLSTGSKVPFTPEMFRSFGSYAGVTFWCERDFRSGRQRCANDHACSSVKYIYDVHFPFKLHCIVLMYCQRTKRMFARLDYLKLLPKANTSCTYSLSVFSPGTCILDMVVTLV